MKKNNTIWCSIIEVMSLPNIVSMLDSRPLKSRKRVIDFECRPDVSLYKNRDDLDRFKVADNILPSSMTWMAKGFRLSATYPVNVNAPKNMLQLRHYYSDNLMIGVKIYQHRTSGNVTTGVYRDVTCAQIVYSSQEICDISQEHWMSCRCLKCLTRHTAKLPDASLLTEDEFVCVSVVEEEPNWHLRRAFKNEPVLWNGVTCWEDRPEFVVFPKDRSLAPLLARNPRVYELKGKEKPLEYFYAELEGVNGGNVRYVIGNNCRYRGYAIMKCQCGICDELRQSCNTSAMMYDDKDNEHYVWCSTYDLRPSHVINSLSIHSFTDTATRYGGVNVGYHRHSHKRLRSEVGEEESANVIVHEIPAGSTSNFAGLSHAEEVKSIVKEIICDGGATKAMFHDIRHFTNYKKLDNCVVRVAEGTVIQVLGVGDVGPLKGVLHVPDLVYSLVSEPVLDLEGKWIVTGRGVKIIYNPDSTGGPNWASVFLTAKLSSKGLYVVNPMHLGLPNHMYNYKVYEANASRAEAIDILHKTLGHINVDRLQDLVMTGNVNWCSTSPPPVNFRRYANPCNACQYAKSKRKSHTGKLRVPVVPGELIYVDVWGPCDTISLINECIYTIGFIDASTKNA